ncbi:MAG: ABC transporter ATP-binding protein [Elusimicrobiota bacterium]
MIEIKNLNKAFGSERVLRSIDLNITDGEIFTLVGGSGEGKSVFIKTIIGIIKPDSGSIKIDKEEIVGLPQHKLTRIQRKIGMVFQGGALFDSLTVGENVAFGLRRLTDYKEEKIQKIVRETLATVRLKGVEKKLPESLSIGMQRRVALARAIATKPRYIFYDEPTTGLDPITTEAICKLFVKLQENFNITSIMVTHDLTTAYKVSDRIGFLKDGEIIEVATVPEFKNSDNSKVQEFIQGAGKGKIVTKNGEVL